MTIRDWYLMVPIRPSPEELVWFNDLVAAVGVAGHWFDADRLDGLAAAHQDVIDCYLHGAEVLELFRRDHADGQTIVLVTHDQPVADAAQRIVRMRDGRVVDDRGRSSHPDPAVVPVGR